MTGSEIQPLCKHAFFLGKECPYCAEDAILMDLMNEAITRLSYTSGLLLGISDRFPEAVKYIDAKHISNENLRFANIFESVREVLEMKNKSGAGGKKE